MSLLGGGGRLRLFSKRGEFLTGQEHFDNLLDLTNMFSMDYAELEVL